MNPSLVSAPSRILPAKARTSSTEGSTEGSLSEPLADTVAVAQPLNLSTRQLSDLGNLPLTSRGAMNKIMDGGKDQAFTKEHTKQAKVCPKAVQLLHDLEAAVNRIPNEMPHATQLHRLSIFAVNPRICVADPGEDDWPILNGMLKSAFGWGESEMAAAIPEMLSRGELGLDGMIQFLTFFVTERGLEGALLETKIEALVRELDKR